MFIERSYNKPHLTALNKPGVLAVQQELGRKALYEAIEFQKRSPINDLRIFSNNQLMAEVWIPKVEQTIKVGQGSLRAYSEGSKRGGFVEPDTQKGYQGIASGEVQTIRLSDGSEVVIYGE